MEKGSPRPAGRPAKGGEEYIAKTAGKCVAVDLALTGAGRADDEALLWDGCAARARPLSPMLVTSLLETG